MQVDAHDEGMPSWIDLGSPDPSKAAAFYGGLFGWEVEDMGPDAGGYGIASLGGKQVAGFGAQQNPGPPVWACYVNVNDADATIAKVTASGGTVIVEPMDVMDAGRMAVFADPAGAVISVWQPNQHKGAQLVNEPGAFSWSELVTTDVEGAKTFYNAVFGWGADTTGEPGMQYTEWKLADRSIGGMMAKTADMPVEMPPYWGIYFNVADVDAAALKVTDLGGSVFQPPMDIEPGRFTLVTDDQGAMFSMITMKEQM